MLLLDANARTGSISASCFGDVDADQENDNGQRLRVALCEAQQAAVNTWYPCGYTWRLNHSKTFRIDYVTIPLFLLCLVIECGVATSVDLSGIAREDHRMVCVRTFADGAVF